MKNPFKKEEKELVTVPGVQIDKKDLERMIQGEEVENQPLPDKALYKLVSELFNYKNIEAITDLTDEQIESVLKFTVANEVFYKRYAQKNKNKYDRIMITLLKLLISRSRKGRTELIDAYIGRQDKQDEGGLIGRAKRFISGD
jgi:hypothetical protein